MARAGPISQAFAQRLAQEQADVGMKEQGTKTGNKHQYSQGSQ